MGSPYVRAGARLLGAALIVATVAGCAGRPAGMMVPVDVAEVPGTSRVNMAVATTRQRTSNGDMFTGERSHTPAFAEITVSIPPDSARTIGDVQWPRSMPPNPATDFVTVEAKEMTKDQAVSWFNKRIRAVPQRQALVFVHGFNNRFDDAVFRFAQIIHDSRADVVPILFTWPSRGKILAYGYDRESSTYSRDALEGLLTFLANDPNVGEISILAHSMGNWVTLEALRQMAIRNKRILPKIKNIMLAAPDVDVDVFRTQMADLGQPRPNITVFTSQDDKALAVSKQVWGSVPRIGQVDADQEPYRTEFLSNNITVIDLTKMKSNDALNHGKFAASPEVVQLIGSRLLEGQTVTDSRVGVGDKIVELTANTASAIGTAAGVVVAAPVAVIDPNSRESYGSHVQSIGDHINESVAPTTAK